MSKRNARICFFMETLNMGGIERITLNLAAEFVNRGLNVDLFISRLTGQYITQIPKGVSVFPGGGRVRNVIPFLRYLFSQKPNVLITANMHVNLMSIIVCKIARLPITLVVAVHIHSSRAYQDSKHIKTRIMMKLAKRIYPLADRVVAVSEAVANDLSYFIDLPMNRIDIIYNPVITPRLFARAKERQDHPWFKRNACPIILGAGRLTEQKDFHTLIRAFAKVREFINAKLMILGEGEDRISLENLISELNLEQDAKLIGYVDNPCAYMVRSSIFVLSSIWEGLPTVLIEALALGTPVVSTDCPGGSKEILDGGKYGTLVPVGDADCLAKAVLEVLHSNPDKEMLKARGRMFSAQRSSDQYLKLLNFTDYQRKE